MKTLVLVAHPSLGFSRVNSVWAEAFAAQTDVTVRDLSALYPEMDIDVIAEQQLLLDHDRIIFQFPFYWYSSPAVLKQWQDLVLTPGFAYAGAHELEGKEFMVVTSIGGTDDEIAQATAAMLRHALDIDIDPERDHEAFTLESMQKMFARATAEAASAAAE